MLTNRKGNMARNDHVYVNLYVELVENIDKVVSGLKWNGAPKYRDRKTFIITACQKLLDEEVPKLSRKRVPAKIQEVTA